VTPENWRELFRLLKVVSSRFTYLGDYGAILHAEELKKSVALILVERDIAEHD
jgi:hypothetical protein